MGRSVEQFIEQWVASGLVTESEAESCIARMEPPPDSGEALARNLIRAETLTKFQAQVMLQGKGKSLRLGNYAILDQIGQGGMGVVYKARHQRMDRIVALKILPPKVVESQDLVDRFLREVKAAARLHHPNIVTAFDADEVKGTYYLVMEYVDGSDLSSLVKKGGVLNVEQSVDVIRQAAEGLQFAHERGVIHRDIKPANLLLATSGKVKILDMGLARIEGDVGQQAELTGTGTVMGTVDYMSPEQALDTRTADARSDIYSLGITLWYLLTGRPAYAGSSLMARMLAHRDEKIPSLCESRQDVPQWLDDVFRKMVAKTASDRFQSMAEVAQALSQRGQGDVKPMVGMGGEDSGLATFLSNLRNEEQTLRPVAASQTVVDQEPDDVVGSAPTMLAVDANVSTDATTLVTPESTVPSKKSKGAGSSAHLRNLGIGGFVVLALFIVVGIPTLRSWLRPPEKVVEVPNNGETTPVNEPQFGLKFDGADDFISFDDFEWTSDAFTIEAYVTASEGGQGGMIVGLSDNFDALQLFEGKPIRDNTRNSGAGIVGDRPYRNIIFRLREGVRQHRALVVDGTQARYYIDGYLVGKDEDILGEPRDWKFTSLTIGCKRGQTEFYDGTIDLIRISKTARYFGKEFTIPQLTTDSDTLALYEFGEADGTTIASSVAGAPVGTIQGANWVALDGSRLSPASTAAQVNPISPEVKSLAEEAEFVEWLRSQNCPIGFESVGRNLKLAADQPYGAQPEVFWRGEMNWINALGPGERLEAQQRLRGCQRFIGGFLPPQDSDSWAEAFASCPALNAVNAVRCDVTDRGLQALGQVSSLQYLNLDECRNLRGNVLPLLAGCTSLKTLELDKRAFENGLIKTHDIQRLQELLPACYIQLAGSNFAEVPGSLPPRPASTAGLHFDGKSSIIVSKPMLRGADACTFEAWVTPEVQTTSYPLVAGFGGIKLKLERGENPTWTWLITHEETGKTAGSIGSAQPVQPGVPVHVAGEWDGSYWRLYVNGHPQTNSSRIRPNITAEAFGLTRETSELAIGGYHNTSPSNPETYFQGTIHSVRVSSTRRYEKTFRPSPVLSSDENTVALYDFTQDPGATAKDLSGHGFDGTVHGATWLGGSAQSAYSLSFDGVDDYVVVPTVAYMGGSFTLEAWFTPERLSDSPVESIPNENDPVQVPLVWEGIGMIVVRGERRQNIWGVSDLAIHDVHGRLKRGLRSHVAFVVTPDALRLYLDGKLVASRDRSKSFPPGAGTVLLGAHIPPWNKDLKIDHFQGSIHAARISKAERYRADFIPGDLSPDAATIACYDFSQGEGNVLKDISGHGHDGTIHGATWMTNRQPQVIVNHALHFDGIDDHLLFDDLKLDERRPDEPLTIEFAIRPAAMQVANPISWLGAHWIAVFQSDQRFGVGQLRERPELVVTNANFEMGQWHQIAAVFDGQNWLLYVDGQLQPVSRLGFDLQPTEGGLYVGGAPIEKLVGHADGRWFTGDIDELRISQVARYSGPSYSPAPRLGTDGDTLGLYHFDEGSGEVIIDSSGHERHGRRVGGEWVLMDESTN
ncbi:MAG: LamG-like jellyroll fold domain-containing protein [Planctomycetaceae bacterium]